MPISSVGVKYNAFLGTKRDLTIDLFPPPPIVAPIYKGARTSALGVWDKECRHQTQILKSHGIPFIQFPRLTMDKHLFFSCVIF